MIGKRLVEAEKTEATISATREKYRPVANRGSILYFVVASLANVDPMYQFSLRYFTDIFNLTIEQAPAQEVLEMRLDQLMEVCSMAIYKNVSRGLFESHKLMFRSEFLIIMFLQCPSLIKTYLLLNPFFSFMMCVDIMRGKDIIADDAWLLFLRGLPPLEKEREQMPPGREWLTEEIWNKVIDIEEAQLRWQLIT